MRSSTERCLKPRALVWARHPVAKVGSISNVGRCDATKAVGEIIKVRYRGFDMRDCMAYTRKP